MPMSQDERSLLLLLAHNSLQADVPNQREIAALMTRIQRPSEGEIVAVRVMVTKVENGLVYFRSDGGTEAYRRVEDIVRNEVPK